MLVQPIEGAIEHHLRGQQLVGSVNLTSSPALQRDDALGINHAQLAQHLRPAETANSINQSIQCTARVAEPDVTRWTRKLASLLRLMPYKCDRLIMMCEAAHGVFGEMLACNVWLHGSSEYS